VALASTCPPLESTRGWQVTATARTASSAKELASPRQTERIAVEQVDIDLPDSVDSLATRLVGHRFDLVFINAGVAGPEHQSVDATTPQEIGALIYTTPSRRYLFHVGYFHS
jgi:NAD(P)-dependent dehydrogenase (short-subunit alcohol dehydrogenase family)